MEDRTKHPEPPHGPGHETTDVNIGAVGKFGVGLVIVTLLSIGLLLGVFKFFNTRDDRQAQMVDPVKIFPSPQLLPNEPKNLAAMHADEDKILHGYGWVDQQKGVVRIPVEQAMDLLVKRGLPVRQASAAQASAVSMPTESGLGAPQVKPHEEDKK
jgi:hypothetical protein